MSEIILTEDLQNRIQAVEIKSQFTDLLLRVVLAQLLGNSCDDLKAEYKKKIIDVGDAVALRIPECFPSWNPNGVAYEVDQKVLYNDVLYKVITAHTSQSTWTPDTAPSLFAKVLTSDDGVPQEWQQPDSTNPYMKGDKVIYKGKVYESTMDNNVWSPEAYPAGWELLEGE